MGIPFLNRSALSVGVAAALLAGCGQSLSPAARNTTAQTTKPIAEHHKKFRYTGSEQFFTVPSGVTQVKIVALGAGTPATTYVPGSRGGLAQGTIRVTPGEKLAERGSAEGRGSAMGF